MITLTGTGFGSDAGLVSAKVGDVAAGVVSVAPVQVRLNAPAASGQVEVTVGGAPAVSLLPFTATRMVTGTFVPPSRIDCDRLFHRQRDGCDRGPDIHSAGGAEYGGYGVDRARGAGSDIYRQNGNVVGIGTATPIPAGSPGGTPILHVVAQTSKTNAAGDTRAFAITTNEPLGATGGAGKPFGLDIRMIGAAALANRAVMMQTTDYNSAGGGNIVLQPGGGRVGIGTTNPTRGALEVTGYQSTTYNIGG